jgi:hypothetical protein
MTYRLTPLVYVLGIVAIGCIIIGRASVEQFLLSTFTSLGYIPVSMQMVINNAQPEHWEHASVKGFDQVYRNMSNLVDYENTAFMEAGWQPVDGYSPDTGPNIWSLVISVALITAVCSSFFVLVALS